MICWFESEVVVVFGEEDYEEKASQNNHGYYCFDSTIPSSYQI